MSQNTHINSPVSEVESQGNTKAPRTFADIVETRYSRRDLFGMAGKLGIAAFAAKAFSPSISLAEELTASASSLTFKEISKSSSQTHAIAEGYNVQLLMRWGDRLLAGAPHFDPLNQTAEAQNMQFGYNNDFIAYMPFLPDGNDSGHGLLCVNHEYVTTYMMFPRITQHDAENITTKEQVDIEMAAHGHSVLEVRKSDNGRWEPVVGSPYNRRISPYATDIAISGPAAGHARMKTKEDATGKMVRGTFGNCAGGVTPWRTVLVSEENFNHNFGNKLPENSPETENHKRYGVGDAWYGWFRFYDRYDLSKEPNEANRFGWVVEYDPYDPTSKPVKRTALGRFKHETATTVLAPDGRVVVYSGDDEKFEYLYRFVSAKKYNPAKREANFGLLDEGTLYVAKFEENGNMEWLPLLFGANGLTPDKNFHSQADVQIEARRAGDVVGATPMDRPEGIAIHPKTGQVFVSLTNNSSRTDKQLNPANTRPYNKYGQIVELLPPNGDHAASKFSWKLFLRGGNPAEKDNDAFYGKKLSEQGWLTNPDNLAISPAGHLWIATDGLPKTYKLNDGLFASEVSGEAYASPKLFFTGPAGCEVTGPCFTPDGETLFLSVQHPGDGKESHFAEPVTRWPDFNPDMPPRPSVIAITRKGGGIIGG